MLYFYWLSCPHPLDNARSSGWEEYAKKDKVAITLDCNWIPQQWTGGNWDEWREHYAFTAMPTQHGQGKGFNSMSGGWGLGISALSQQKDLALDFTHFRPTNEEYPSVSTELQVAVESVVTGTQTPEEAQDDYLQSLKRIVGENKVMSK